MPDDSNREARATNNERAQPGALVAEPENAQCCAEPTCATATLVEFAQIIIDGMQQFPELDEAVRRYVGYEIVDLIEEHS